MEKIKCKFCDMARFIHIVLRHKSTHTGHIQILNIKKLAFYFTTHHGTQHAQIWCFTETVSSLNLVFLSKFLPSKTSTIHMLDLSKKKKVGQGLAATHIIRTEHILLTYLTGMRVRFYM